MSCYSVYIINVVSRSIVPYRSQRCIRRIEATAHTWQ